MPGAETLPSTAIPGANAEAGEEPTRTPRKRFAKLAAGLGDRVAKTFGDRFVAELAKRRSGVEQELAAIPDRIHKVARQASLVLELVEDYRRGNYRDIALRSVALAAGALLYTVSPSDVVPDFLPLLGSIDDAFVLSVAMRLMRRDLERYCRFKGYAVEDYFD